MIDVINLSHQRVCRTEESKYIRYYSNCLKYNINIFFIDLVFISRIKKFVLELFNKKYNIAVFWWEFETGCDERIRILNNFDEVYVFIDFLKNVLLNFPDRKFTVTKIKYLFRQDWIIEDKPVVMRERYNLKNKF